MPLFEVPKRAGKEEDKNIVSKTNKKNKAPAAIVKGGGSLFERISAITSTVKKYLGKYEDQYIKIQDESTLINYIDSAIKNHIISIDTETTGLDPILDNIAGISIYTPNEKPAYIPINHISYITNQKVPGQLSVEFIRGQFERLIENKIEIIMFNAVFDIRVLRNQVGLKDIYCTWDCYLAARLLNENEESNKLKVLHKKYVLNGEGDAFSFDELFKGISFDLIPIDSGYLYAAHDAIITYEFYQFQKPFLTADDEICKSHNLQDVAWVFKNIEMPCIQVVCDMEDNGIEFNFDYAKQLSEKYNKLLADRKQKFYDICAEYKAEIDDYNLRNKNSKLENPINISSPTQIAILLYDVLKIEPVSNKNPRGTGEDILQKIDNDLAKCILDYREVEKLLSTYIDKLPECANPKDGRIHCNFNLYGANTGRMSSENPNRIGLYISNNICA